MTQPGPPSVEPTRHHSRADRQQSTLAGIFCRSGVHHDPAEPGQPPCAVCVELAEFAAVAYADHVRRLDVLNRLGNAAAVLGVGDA